VPVPTSATSRKTASATERHAKVAVARTSARPAKGAAASGRRTQGLRVDPSPPGVAAAPFTRAVLKGLRPHPTAVEPAAPAAGSTQRIVDAITTAIVERRLMPGTKLVEQQIADIFKVSRTLVRQALNQLSRDHLVTLEPARGAFVAQPSVDEAHQVFEVRKMLEGSMVRQLCSAITDDQIARLRQHVRAEADALARTDVTGRTRLLADFHVVLARMLGNEVLAHLLADLLSRSQLISLMYQSSLSAAHSSEEHTNIVDALERRDARAAARLMEHHLSNVSRNLQLHPRVSDLARVLKDA
jgi:DNA-binding GntR family transcriptional regulator